MIPPDKRELENLEPTEKAVVHGSTDPHAFVSLQVRASSVSSLARSHLVVGEGACARASACAYGGAILGSVTSVTPHGCATCG